MKFCAKCGGSVQDDAVFCLNCGSSITNSTPVEFQEEPAEPVLDSPAPVECEELPDAAPICAAEEPAEEAAPPMPRKKKSKGKLIGIIVGGIVLLAAIAFVIIGFVTNWFGGPLGGLANACAKTWNAGNFTLNLSASIDMSKSYDSSMGIIGDPTMGSLMSDLSGEFKIDIDRENRELIVLADIPVREYAATILIHNCSMYMIARDQEDQILSAQTQQLPQESFDELFDILNGDNETNDEALEKLLEQLDSKADVEELKAFFQSIGRECLGNQEWLEEFLGFEKKDNKYTFEIDVDDLTKDLAERAYEADIISKSQKKSMTSTKSNATIEIDMTVEGGYLTELEMLMDTETMDISFIMEFSDINKTEITEDDINDTKDTVTEYVDTYYAVCGKCEEQHKKLDMHQIGDDFYCGPCYFSLEICRTCNEIHSGENMTYLNGKHYCADCYAEYKNTHTCDLCGTLTGENSICYNHRGIYDHCSECGTPAQLSYYNVQTKEYVCSYCQSWKKVS